MVVYGLIVYIIFFPQQHVHTIKSITYISCVSTLILDFSAVNHMKYFHI